MTVKLHAVGGYHPALCRGARLLRGDPTLFRELLCLRRTVDANPVLGRGATEAARPPSRLAGHASAKLGVLGAVPEHDARLAIACSRPRWCSSVPVFALLGLAVLQPKDQWLIFAIVLMGLLAFRSSGSTESSDRGSAARTDVRAQDRGQDRTQGRPTPRRSSRCAAAGACTQRSRCCRTVTAPASSPSAPGRYAIVDPEIQRPLVRPQHEDAVRRTSSITRRVLRPDGIDLTSPAHRLPPWMSRWAARHRRSRRESGGAEKRQVVRVEHLIANAPTAPDAETAK